MHQQINLYQPIFREERKLFSLKTVAIALGIVSISLGVMWFVGAHKVGALEAAIASLNAQKAAQEKMAQSANAFLEQLGTPAAIQEQINVLNAQLADRRNALNLLRGGVVGETKGFAPRLLALASQRTEGVWLDELVLASGPNGLALRGHSVAPELVPRYLQLLSRESALSGARFDQVVIDRYEHHDPAAQALEKPRTTGANVRFSVSSATVSFQPEGPGT